MRMIIRETNLRGYQGGTGGRLYKVHYTPKLSNNFFIDPKRS